jgi:ribosomal protein S18 acetylase RimI-like enzyme
LDEENDRLLVAVAGDEVVGTAFAHVMVPSTVSDEPAVELSGVIVRPDHRGRGIARALTTEAARFARERGIRRITIKVFAQNEDGMKLWESLGFRPRMLQMTIAPEELLPGAN